MLPRVDRKRAIVLVHVIVIEYQAQSGNLSGIVRRLSPAMDDGVLALTLNPAATGRRGNMIGTVPKRSYDYDDDNDNDHGFSITGFFWLTCNSAPLR